MSQALADGWQPEQYQRFATQRAQAFYDLVDLLEPVPGGNVIDLGCGTGELTVELHRRLDAAHTIGVDSSPAMLEVARRSEEPGVAFADGDIGEVDEHDAYDVVFANASLQWVPGHEALLARLARALRAGGQLAVQVPANADHPSHTVVSAVAREEPFVSAMGGSPPADTVARAVLHPERYAELLHELGFQDQHVRLQVYGHVLESTADVVEWTKGTTLVRFRRAMPAELFTKFVETYSARLRETLGEQRPYFYAFKRILFWARR